MCLFELVVLVSVCMISKSFAAVLTSDFDIWTVGVCLASEFRNEDMRYTSQSNVGWSVLSF